MKKYTVITGASAGIGRALAEEFARHGHDVVLVARNTDKLKHLSAELNSRYGVEALYLSADLTDESGPDKVFAVIRDRNFHVSCLINNAGMGDACLFEKTDMKKDENIVKLNILALMKMNRLFIPYLKENGGGTIANIGSTLAFAPTAGEAVYAASKAFVLSFSQALY
jgi:short-subunit dehydrogenase